MIGNIKLNRDIFVNYFHTLSSDNHKDKKLVTNTLVLTNGALDSLETYAQSNVNIVVENQVPSTLVDIPILDDSAIIVSEPHVDVKRKRMHLDIIETSSITAYKDVEKRFYQSHDIDDALFLAKSYYKKNNYKKAEYWALQTNKLDSNLEESLLIFVKSKIKLGRKNEAISILMAYVKKTNSEEGKNLLYRVNNNKFK